MISPAHTSAYTRLREYTPARVGLGRAGAAIPTHARLELLTAHAEARDAVHSTIDVDVLRTNLKVDEFIEISSKAADREEYLARPDFGRQPKDAEELQKISSLPKADIGIILADGLSPNAVNDHGAHLYEALRKAFTDRAVAPPVIAHGARVALGDYIGAAAGWDVTVVVIGERPGLSVPSSLGIYSTWKTQPGKTDEARNCISNIHPPEGMAYSEAAGILKFYVDQYYATQSSGCMIKAAEQQTQLPQ